MLRRGVFYSSILRGLTSGGSDNEINNDYIMPLGNRPTHETIQNDRQVGQTTRVALTNLSNLALACFQLYLFFYHSPDCEK